MYDVDVSQNTNHFVIFFAIELSVKNSCRSVIKCQRGFDLFDVLSQVLLSETVAFECVGVRIHCSAVSWTQRLQSLGQLENAQSARSMRFI